MKFQNYGVDSGECIQYKTFKPAQIRELIRQGEIKGPTAGYAEGFAQANIMIVKKEHAFDFLLFCQRHPASCPLLDVLDPVIQCQGDQHIKRIFGQIFRSTEFTEKGSMNKRCLILRSRMRLVICL